MNENDQQIKTDLKTTGNSLKGMDDKIKEMKERNVKKKFDYSFSSSSSCFDDQEKNDDSSFELDQQYAKEKANEVEAEPEQPRRPQEDMKLENLLSSPKNYSNQANVIEELPFEEN